MEMLRGKILVQKLELIVDVSVDSFQLQLIKCHASVQQNIHLIQLKNVTEEMDRSLKKQSDSSASQEQGRPPSDLPRNEYHSDQVSQVSLQTHSH